MLIEAGVEFKQFYHVFSGNIEAVKFISHLPRYNVNSHNENGRSALHYASMKGYYDVCRYLLSIPGINVNMVDANGRTPLDYACNQKIEKLLLSVGAYKRVIK